MVRSLSRKVKLIGTALTTGAGCQLGIGAPAAGKTRYITFLHVQNLKGVQQEVIFVSKATDYAWARRSAATTHVSTNQKASQAQVFRVQLQAKQHVQIPVNGPTDDAAANPIFTIAASKYLNALPTMGSATVFVHYFDQ